MKKETIILLTAIAAVLAVIVAHYFYVKSKTVITVTGPRPAMATTLSTVANTPAGNTSADRWITFR
jgi:hypothetical protein